MLDKRTTLLSDEAVQLSTAKVYVLSDSVLCLGKMNPHPESIESWEKEDWAVYRFTSISRIGSNRRGATGIRVEKFLRIHFITDSRRGPENDERKCSANLSKSCKGNVSCTSYSRTFGYGILT